MSTDCIDGCSTAFQLNLSSISPFFLFCRVSHNVSPLIPRIISFAILFSFLSEDM